MRRPSPLARRSTAATVLVRTVIAATVLLGAAACGSDDEEPAAAPSAGGASAASVAPAPGTPGSATPAGSAAPAPSGVPASTVPIPAGTGPASGNADQICATVTRDSSAAVTAYVGQIAAMAQAGPDTADGKKAQAAAEKALDDWQTSLTTQANAATDARLKAVLTNMAVQVGTMTADLEALGGGQVEQLQATLDELCGG